MPTGTIRVSSSVYNRKLANLCSLKTNEPPTGSGREDNMKIEEICVRIMNHQKVLVNKTVNIVIT